MHQSTAEEGLLCAKDAAKFLEISLTTLNRYVKQKLITPHRAEYGKRGGARRFSKKDLRAVFIRR